MKTVQRQHNRLIPQTIAFRSLDDVARWVAIHDVEEQRYRDSNVVVTASSVGTAPPPPGGGGAPIVYQHWYFPTPQSGIVLIGRVNGTRGRLWVDDTEGNYNNVDMDNPAFRVETATVKYPGDLWFESAYAGPVLHGRFRFNGTQPALYRLWLDDTNPDDIALRMELIYPTQTNNADLVFASPGFSFVNRGRPYNHRWFWYVDNSDGDMEDGAALRIERFI